jgi:drug/metabolite transporter (DMT)-like permease
MVLFTSLYTIGLKLSTATNTVILELATVVWTSAASILIGREKKGILKIIGNLFISI